VLKQDRQCAYNVILRYVHKPLLQYKAISDTYSEGVSVALGTQHAMRMYNIVICGLHGSTKFFTLDHKRHNSRKELPNIKYVFRFSQQLFS